MRDRITSIDFGDRRSWLGERTLTFEATAHGLFVHQMIGIVPDRVRDVYRVPEDVQPLTGLAIGYAADPESVSEPFRGRDLAPRERNALAEFVFESAWGAPSKLMS